MFVTILPGKKAHFRYIVSMESFNKKGSLNFEIEYELIHFRGRHKKAKSVI